eukprot:1309363-Pleurochrysis_carterae.AAC.1
MLCAPLGLRVKRKFQQRSAGQAVRLPFSWTRAGEHTQPLHDMGLEPGQEKMWLKLRSKRLHSAALQFALSARSAPCAAYACCSYLGVQLSVRVCRAA